jgi:hypothetical protein
VSKCLSDVGNKDNHIRTSGKTNPSTTNAVEEIGVTSDNIKQAMNPTHGYTEVNSATTKDAHHNFMGATEPKPDLNNPAQTENNSTDIASVSHQDLNEDADPTANDTSFRISIEFRTIQSTINPIMT